MGILNATCNQVSLAGLPLVCLFVCLFSQTEGPFVSSTLLLKSSGVNVKYLGLLSSKEAQFAWIGGEGVGGGNGGMVWRGSLV